MSPSSELESWKAKIYRATRAFCFCFWCSEENMHRYPSPNCTIISRRLFFKKQISLKMAGQGGYNIHTIHLNFFYPQADLYATTHIGSFSFLSKRQDVAFLLLYELLKLQMSQQREKKNKQRRVGWISWMFLGKSQFFLLKIIHPTCDAEILWYQWLARWKLPNTSKERKKPRKLPP